MLLTVIRILHLSFKSSYKTRKIITNNKHNKQLYFLFLYYKYSLWVISSTLPNSTPYTVEKIKIHPCYYSRSQDNPQFNLTVSRKFSHGDIEHRKVACNLINKRPYRQVENMYMYERGALKMIRLYLNTYNLLVFLIL